MLIRMGQGAGWYPPRTSPTLDRSAPLREANISNFIYFLFISVSYLSTFCLLTFRIYLLSVYGLSLPICIRVRDLLFLNLNFASLRVDVSFPSCISEFRVVFVYLTTGGVTVSRPWPVVSLIYCIKALFFPCSRHCPTLFFLSYCCPTVSQPSKPPSRLPLTIIQPSSCCLTLHPTIVQPLDSQPTHPICQPTLFQLPYNPVQPIHIQTSSK